jgi:hypothetical protein
MATLVGYVDGNSGWGGWPSGTVAGDIALITATCNGTLGNMTGWTELPLHSGVLTGSNVDAAWKLLTAEDITNGPASPDTPQGFAMMVVVRGGSEVIESSAGNVGNTGTSTIPGFTKNADCQLIVVLQADRDPADVVGYPTGWTGIDSSVGTYFLQKLSYKQPADYNGEDIACPLPSSQYDGLGIAYEFIGSELDPLTLEAEFVGPHGFVEGVVLNAGDDVIVEPVRLGAGKFVLEATAVTFVDTTPPTYIALAADFVGPHGDIDAFIGKEFEVFADFVGPHGKVDGIVINGYTVEADFVGPSGRMEAVLEVVEELSLEAAFVGPHGGISAQIEFFAIEAGFVGPSGYFEGALLGEAGIWASFTGPSGALAAEINNTIEIEAAFVGPHGYISGQLGEDNRTIEAAFVGPHGALAAELETDIAVFADFVGPTGSLGAEISNPMVINASFVGPHGSVSGEIMRGLRVDAFLRGPHGYVEAYIAEPPTPVEINYSFKKFSMSMTAQGSYNSSLTFILVQP